MAYSKYCRPFNSKNSKPDLHADLIADSFYSFLDSRLGKVALILTVSAGLTLLLRTNQFREENKDCQVSYLQTSCSESSCSGKRVDSYLGKKDLGQLIKDYYSGQVHRLKINCYE
jgi:hypothetical protein